MYLAFFESIGSLSKGKTSGCSNKISTPLIPFFNLNSFSVSACIILGFAKKVKQSFPTQFLQRFFSLS